MCKFLNINVRQFGLITDLYWLSLSTLTDIISEYFILTMSKEKYTISNKTLRKINMHIFLITFICARLEFFLSTFLNLVFTMSSIIP